MADASELHGENEARDDSDSLKMVEPVPESTEEEQEEAELNEEDEATTDDGEEDGGDSEEDEEDEEDEDEEEEEEPQLKYSRITNLPVTANDAISQCLFHEDLFVFATHSGVLHLTDGELNPIRSVKAHTASVLSLSTDGHYLASASIDGTVVVGSIADKKDISAANFGRPVHAVALDPNYRSTKAYISGGMAGKVIHSEKNWLGRRVDTVVEECESSIIAVYWIDDLYIWMNESGITVYNRHTNTIALKIDNPGNVPRIDMYRPHVSVPESNRIYIAWANNVWVLHKSIEKPKFSSIISSGASIRSIATEYKVTVESYRAVDWLISGIAEYGHDNIMMLAYATPPEENNRAGPPAPPEIKLYDIGADEEVYADVISLKGYERLGVNDYHLAQAAPNKFYIISAKDAVLATKRDMKDRIDWLLERERYQEAWEISETTLDMPTRCTMGLRWVRVLVDKREWARAAWALGQVLAAVDPDTRREEWEHWGRLFVDAGETDTLGAAIPTDADLGIDQSLYDTILQYYLDHSEEKVLECINRWPTELYDLESLKAELEDKVVANPQNKPLRKALVSLYISSSDPASAVGHLLVLKDASVLGLIREYHLLPTFVARLEEIFTVGIAAEEEEQLINHAPIAIVRDRTAEAVELVVDARHQVLPSTVVEHMAGNDNNNRKRSVLLFLYLDKLNAVDPFQSKGFGDLQVKLYAEYDRTKLIAFIRKSNNYNLGRAIEETEKRGYIEELVYLLGKVGQNKKALKLIIDKLRDPLQAIEFAKAQNDRDLWGDLIDYSMDKPDFVRQLLLELSGTTIVPQGDLGGGIWGVPDEKEENASRAGTLSIDPLVVIKRMTDAIEIPELRHVLVTIFTEKETIRSIHRGTLQIVRDEAQGYSQKLRTLRTHGDALSYDDPRLAELDLTKPLVITPEGAVEAVTAAAAHDVPPCPAGYSIRPKVEHLRKILGILH